MENTITKRGLTVEIKDLVRLPEAHTHVPAAVAHDDEGGEGEPTSALHHLGHAIDGDHLVLQLEPARIDAPLRHVLSSRPGR